MTKRLAGLVGFLDGFEESEEFQQTIKEDIIEPAFQLQEQILSSTRIYSFKLRPARAVNEAVKSRKTVKELIGILNGLELINMADGYRKLRFDERQPQVTPEQFHAGLLFIAALSPELQYMEVPPGHDGNVDDGSLIPAIAERQQMLVFWNPPGSINTPRRKSESWLTSILLGNR